MAHTAATPATCRTRDHQPLVLQSVHAQGRVAGRMLDMGIEQTYRNPTDGNVEVVYTFPLPWGAVLMGLEVVLAGKTLAGRVVAKPQARQTYEDALVDGDSAVLLSVNADGSHTVELGNLMAHEECLIRLRYVQVLAWAQGSLRLLLPTTLAPRYGDAVLDGGFEPHAVPLVDAAVEYPFAIRIDIEGDLAVARISSPSHRLTQQTVGAAVGTSGTPGPNTRIELAAKAWLDRDFVLTLDALPHDSLAVAARDGLATQAGLSVVMASFTSRLLESIDSAAGLASVAPSRLPVRLKVLVDCSGSMNGDSIQSARSALLSILGGLGEGDRFSLSRFGSTVEHRSKALWKGATASLAAARRWVETLEADLGGTEMNEAVVSTLALPTPGQEVCDVLLITDGEIHASRQLLDTARASGHRFMVVGIGSAVAEVALRELAACTGGNCEFVAPGEAVEPAILRLYHRLRSPVIQDVRIQWPEGVEVQDCSTLPECLFDGDDLLVSAQWRVPTEVDLRQPIRLFGKKAGSGVEVVLAEVRPTWLVDEANTLARWVAHRRCGQIQRQRSTAATADSLAEDRTSWTNGMSEMVGTVTEAPAKDLAAQDLAVQYQLVTADTSLVLVHQRAAGEQAQDMPELLQVRAMLQAGWGGLGSVHKPDMKLYRRDLLSMGGMASTPDSLSVPAVFRTSRTPVDHPAVSGGSGIDAFEVPAFLRRQSDSAPRTRKPKALAQLWSTVTGGKAPSSARSLTPIGLASWLKKHPQAQWPHSYAGLLAIGLPARVVEWLEWVVGAEATASEAAVVQTFLQVVEEMNRSVWARLVARVTPASASPATITNTTDAGHQLGGVGAAGAAGGPLAACTARIRAVLGPSDGKNWPQGVLDFAEDRVDL